MAKKGAHEFTKTMKKMGGACRYVCLRCGRKYWHTTGSAWNPRGPICPGKLVGRAASSQRRQEAHAQTTRRMFSETCRDRRAKKRTDRKLAKTRGKV